MAGLAFAFGPRLVFAEGDAQTPAEKDEKEGKIFGQDPKQLMKEGGLTLVGFLVVLGPTLLRGFGVGVPTAEDQVSSHPASVS